MTRVEAAAVVEAMDDYVDSAFAALLSGIGGDGHDRARMFEFERQAGAARERLITALCGEEPTQPLAGNERSE